MSKWNLGNATLVILNEILFTARVLTTRVSINKKGADLFIKAIFKPEQSV